MIPLLLGSVLMFAVILERGIIFLKTGFRQDRFDSVLGMLKSGNSKGAEELAASDSSYISRFLHKTIVNLKEPVEILENELSIYGDKILEGLGKHLHLLSLTGRVAPMVGLLGTVMGMVDAFQKVAGAEGTADPSLLAGGIYTALVTTVAGLFVGIPALIAHSLFENRLNTVAFKMKHFSEELIARVKK